MIIADSLTFFFSPLGFCGIREKKLNEIIDGIWYVPSLHNNSLSLRILGAL